MPTEIDSDFSRYQNKIVDIITVASLHDEVYKQKPKEKQWEQMTNLADALSTQPGNPLVQAALTLTEHDEPDMVHAGLALLASPKATETIIGNPFHVQRALKVYADHITPLTSTNPTATPAHAESYREPVVIQPGSHEETAFLWAVEGFLQLHEAQKQQKKEHFSFTQMSFSQFDQSHLGNLPPDHIELLKQAATRPEMEHTMIACRYGVIAGN